MEKYAGSKLIGEGSFGRVYKATNIETKETVALKVIGKVFTRQCAPRDCSA